MPRIGSGLPGGQEYAIIIKLLSDRITGAEMTPKKFASTRFLAVAGVAALAVFPLGTPKAIAANVTIDVPGCTSSLTPTVSGTTVTLTCGTVAPPPAGSPVCTVAATPSSNPIPSTGGSVFLKATCTGTVTNYQWYVNGAAAGASVPEGTVPVPANSLSSAITITYGVVACNGTACMPSPATASIQVAGTGVAPPPPPPGTISCTGYTKTLVIDMPWVSTTVATRLKTDSYGSFGATDIMVIRFTVPSGVVSTSGGMISMAEWGGGPVQRYAALSQTPCDFNKTLWNEELFTGVTLSPSVFVGIPRIEYGGMFLQPGQTYYFNVRNTDRYGNLSCDAGVCNMYIDFLKPAGT